MKRQLMVHGPGGSFVEGRNSTCSSSSSKSTVQLIVVPPAVRTSTSLMASSAALSTISSTVSWTSASMRDAAREGGGRHVRLDLDVVRLGFDRPRQAERLRAGRAGRPGGRRHPVKVTRGAAGRFSLRACLRIRHRPCRLAHAGRRGPVHDLDVVAIGSPLLDVIEMATDEQLARVGLEKGSMTLIDLATANAVQESMGAPRYVSGGSVANTTAGIAELGGTAGFVGAVADDEIGRTYSENLRAGRRRVRTALQRIGCRRRARHGTLHRPDHRGRRPHHGDLPGRGVHPVARGRLDLLRGPRLCRPARGLPLGRAGRQGGDAPCRQPPPTPRRGRSPCRCRTPSASNATNASSSTCWSTTSTSCSATRRRSPCSSGPPRTGAPLRRRRRPGLLVVMTRGARGATVLTAQGPEEIPAAAVERVVDTTGAGDLFAAGFLFGLTHGMGPVDEHQAGRPLRSRGDLPHRCPARGGPQGAGGRRRPPAGVAAAA